MNKNNVKSDVLLGKRSAKLSEQFGEGSSEKVGIEKSEKSFQSNILRKKAMKASRHLNEKKRSILKESERSDHEENQPSLGEQMYDVSQKGFGKINSGSQVDTVANKTLSGKPTKKLSCALPPLDADSEKR